MLNDIFSNFSSGCIGRTRYFGLVLMLNLMLGIFSFFVSDDSFNQTLALALVGLALLLNIVGAINLTAKRARDIERPVWLAILLYVATGGLFFFVLSVIPSARKM